VIAFGTTYDVPSQAQVKFLAQVHRDHTPRINVALIVLEQPENEVLVAAFADALGLRFPVALADAATIRGEGPFAGLRHVPSVVILDREGRERTRNLGLMSNVEIEEALTNVIKHSQARHVRLSLRQPQAQELLLEIEDDGVGFDVQAVEASGLGVGMRSMAVRIARVGGLLEIDRRPKLSVQPNGSLHFGSQASGLLQSVPSGWGGRSFKAIDCRASAPSVEPEPKAKCDLKSRRPDTQTQAPSVEPEPAADTQELQQAQHALELMKSGQIESFDQVQLIPG
jgi:hypothetical protein